MPESAETLVVIDATPPEPNRKTPRRRLVQSTLFPCKSLINNGNGIQEEEEEEEEEEGEDYEEYGGSQSKKNKRERKRKAKTKPKRTPPAKAPMKGQDAKSCTTENGNAHLTNGSEFFLKVSEKKLQKRQQKEQGGACSLEGNSNTCTVLESVASKRSCRQLKEKQQGDGSPCKTLTPRKLKGPHCRRLMVSCDAETANEVDTQHAPEPVFDLRLEAKLAAEENARLFTGKQTHPFFSSWKMGKKLQGIAESTEPESKQCLVLQEDESSKPVHVFEVQDDPVSLNWSKWIFCDEAILDSNCAPETVSLSFFEDIIEPLKIDNIHMISTPHGASSLQNEVSLDNSSAQLKDAHTNSETVSSANGQGPHHHLEDDVSKMDTEPQDRSLQERRESYYCHANQPESSLWTDIYQPNKASEVCGNSESVGFLNEWLGSWRGKYSQTSKTSTSGTKHVIEELDYSWDGNDSDAESMDGRDNLKNVLLVTGPVGSGKSAAIYACAKEQGFQVIEVSASDWRNGAHVKQKFGAAMESLGLNKWSPGLKRKRILEFPSAQPGKSLSQEFDDEVVELVLTACKEQSGNVEHGSQDVLVKDTISVCRSADKTLLLLEDVDTIFDEDRGFIATIQQIAETAKRPMILTSNREDPVLPDQLDRLEVSFETPSSEEVLSHVHKVCAAEKADIQPQLLDKLIKCCQSDIRKIIMMLQFWGQGKMNKIDRKHKIAYGAMQFDLDAGHWVLPKVVPWDFPCQLSKLVNEEVTQALSIVKENASFLDVVDEDLGSQEMQDPLGMDIEAKKEAMLNRNYSIPDSSAFPAQFDNLTDFSNSLDSPVAFTRRTARQGPSTVLSSHSGDDFPGDNIPVDPNILCGDISNVVLPSFPPSSLVHTLSVEDYPDPSTAQLQLSERETSEQNLYNCSQTESDQYICEIYKFLDISCVPESILVPETEINDGVELQSRTVSCGHVAASLEAASFNTVKSVACLSIIDAENVDQVVTELDRNPETIFTNPCDLVVASVRVDEEVGDSHHEHAGDATRGYQVLDECSRADFNVASISGAGPTCMVHASSVQERWKSLRSSRADLDSYLTSELKDASQIVELTSKMTDLISIADLMFGCCQPLINDFLEPSMVPSAEPDTFGWYDEQLQMTSTIAEHGYCLFAKESTVRGRNLSIKSTADLASEMLASTSNTAILGKLVAQDVGMNQSSFARKGFEIGSSTCDIPQQRRTEADLYNMIQNVVPSKLYLALKDAALHDYVSSLAQISKLEASRLSVSIGTKKPRRRKRAGRHYLSNGPLTLSPEDVSFLTNHCCYGKKPLDSP